MPRVTDKQREIALLTHLGFYPNEIAERLNIPKVTVVSYLKRPSFMALVQRHYKNMLKSNSWVDIMYFETAKYMFQFARDGDAGDTARGTAISTLFRELKTMTTLANNEAKRRANRAHAHKMAEIEAARTEEESNGTDLERIRQLLLPPVRH